MKTIIKTITILLIITLLITGCSSKTTGQIKPASKTESIKTFDLTNTRIQVNQYETIEYLKYVTGDVENVEHTTIDTANLGTYTINYSLKNDESDNQKEKTLTVDVVRTYENNIFNPTDLSPETITNPEDITALVNKTHQIPEGWVPDDLVDVANTHQQLRYEAAMAFQQFYNAAINQGITCYVISGYRTNDTQALYWQRQVEIYGEEYASQYSAYPGRSEHQLGLAIDVSNQLTGDRLTEEVANSDIGKFIISDGYKYGFILRYPKDKISITNYGYEPWHLRYVGKELATKLHEENLTLEEYYEVNIDENS